jgi:cytochrome b6-f complex iron-sulfur subunit
MIEEAAVARPNEARHAVKPSVQEAPTRRAFLTWGGAGWLFFFAWLGGLGHLLVRFMFPNALYEAEARFSAGRKTDFPECPKVYENFKAAQAVWLVRLVENGQDRLVALSTVCTHLGCTPNWLEAERRFKCPCHGSGYCLDGLNVEGPAPRPLERYRIFLDGAGRVVVDKSRSFRQDLGQWDDREAFLLMT